MSDDEDIPEYYTPLQKELLKICRKVSPTAKEVFSEFSDKEWKEPNYDVKTHAGAACKEAFDVMNDRLKGQYDKRMLGMMATEIKNRMNAMVQAEELLQRYNTHFTVDYTRIDPCGYDFEVHAYVENVPTMTTTVQIRPEKSNVASNQQGQVVLT